MNRHRCRHVGVRCLVHRRKAAKVFSAAVDGDLRNPVAVLGVLMDTLTTTFAVALDAFVLSVLLVCCQAQIHKSVVCAISVFVVNLLRWPFAICKHPGCDVPSDFASPCRCCHGDNNIATIGLPNSLAGKLPAPDIPGAHRLKGFRAAICAPVKCPRFGAVQDTGLQVAQRWAGHSVTPSEISQARWQPSGSPAPRRSGRRCWTVLRCSGFPGRRSGVGIAHRIRQSASRRAACGAAA